MRLMLALQATGLPAPTPLPSAAVPDRLQVVRKCPTGDAGEEVVVCGRPGQERFRLRPPPRQPVKAGPPRAEAKLSNGTVGVRAEDAGVGGFTSHRVMVGIKLPF